MTNTVAEQIVQQTAEKFIKMLEESKGKGQWIKPFFADINPPVNFESKKVYRGFNFMLLSIVQEENQYTSRKWGTFDQWKKSEKICQKGRTRHKHNLLETS